MVKSLKVTISILFLASISSIGQLPPVLTHLTVDPYRADVTLEWLPSPTEDVQFYRIYYYDPIMDGNFRIDTVDSYTTKHTFHFPMIEERSISFSLDAYVDTNKESILSNKLASSHSNIIYDTCDSYICLFLDINSPQSEKDSFNIYFMNDTSLTGSTSKKIFITKEYPINQEVCYYIETINPDKKPYNSSKACVFTGQTLPPLYINTNKVNVINNSIQVDFSIDSTSETSQYYLLRSINDTIVFDTIYKYFNYNSKSLTYIDNNASSNNINTYKLLAYNNCSTYVKSSNTGNNIVLKSTLNDNLASLSWNSYNSWPGGTDHYVLYRYSGNNTQLDSILLSGSELSYYDDLTDLINGGYFDKVCYFIEAREGNKIPYNIEGKSRSNGACVNIEPIIPNAFTPNGDNMNDTYRPVKLASVKNYKLMITDRWGYRVFESADPNEEWDGSHPKKGEIQPGAYVFYLKFTTQDGREIVKNGTVTIILPDQN